MVFLSLQAAGSEQPAKQDAVLVKAFAALGEVDNYSFLLSVFTNYPNSILKDSSFKSVSLNYCSRSEGILYASGDFFTYLFCKQGTFKEFKDQKIILYHIYETDSSWQKVLGEKMQEVNGSALVDSLMLRHAIVKSRKKIKGRLQYQLEYPDSSLIRNATVILNEQADFISEISYLAVQPVSPLYPDVFVNQTCIMNQYRQGQLSELKVMLHDIGTDLRQYLKKRFPDYQLKEL